MDETQKVFTAIAAVMAEIGAEGIAKGRRNQQQGYSFRGIDEVYNALSPILAKHKLVMLPRILSREVVERQTQKGGALFNVTVEAEFDLVSAEDGSKHTVRTFGEAMDSADKATNKAMSAAYKYAAMQTFCIPTEGDNDADAQTHEVAPRQQPAQVKTNSKADSRAVYDRLSRENRALTTEADFNAYWAKAENQEAAKSLPADWKQSLKSEKDDKAAELSERAGLADQETPFDERNAA